MYLYGIFIQMVKKTLNMDVALLAEARAACGAATDTAAVRAGLEALVQRAAYQKLRTLLGSEAGPRAEVADVPRRREPALAKRHAAR